MAFDFSTLVTDRTQQDVAYARQLVEKLVTGTATEAEIAEWNSFTLKGVYNHTDLNRVTAAMDALKAKLEGYGYAVPGYQRIKVPHNPPPVPSASRLPEGYMELSWIEGTGTQYVDTGVKMTNRSTVDLKLTFTSASYTGLVFGSRTSATAKNFAWAQVGTKFQIDYRNYSENRFQQEIDTNGTIIHVDPTSCIINGTEYAISGSDAFEADTNAYIFNASGSNFTTVLGKFKLYSCRISDSDTLVRNFIPCINPSGDVGLFDVVNDVFYHNAGSGAFTAGEEIVVPATASDAVVADELIEYDPYTWYEFDWPTQETMALYLINLSIVRNVLELFTTTPSVPTGMDNITVQEANHIEQILFDVEKVIYQVVNGFPRNAAFTFWSGNRPLPSATSDIGRTWEELDAMQTKWVNWQLADWYLLLYGNLKAEGVIE